MALLPAYEEFLSVIWVHQFFKMSFMGMGHQFSERRISGQAYRFFVGVENAMFPVAGTDEDAAWDVISDFIKRESHIGTVIIFHNPLVAAAVIFS